MSLMVTDDGHCQTLLSDQEINLLKACAHKPDTNYPTTSGICTQQVSEMTFNVSSGLVNYNTIPLELRLKFVNMQTQCTLGIAAKFLGHLWHTCHSAKNFCVVQKFFINI